MGVKSAERVLEIFELLSRFPNGLTSKEIGDELGYAASSTFALVRTLAEKEYLLESDSKRYSLGAKLIQLGEYAAAYLDIHKIAEPILRELMNKVNETVFMAVLSGDEIVYVAKEDSFRSISTKASLGGHKPIYCTGLGKAFLAFLPEEKSDAIIERTVFTAYTPNTILDKEKLKAQCARFRAQGFAVDNEEIELGLYCFAAPIYGAAGRMEAAISVSGPTARMQMDQERIVESVLDASRRISEKLGYYGQEKQRSEI